MNDLSLDINLNGITEENLNTLEKYGKCIIEGRAAYTRFTDAELQGFRRGGSIHAEASLIAGRSKNAGCEQESFEVATQDERVERQEEKFAEYAQKRGVWHDVKKILFQYV